jgi:hypothetical protein
MKYLFLLLVLLTTLSGCLRPDDIWAKDATEANTLIFQSEYTNYAWGYNHNGWIMDSSGKVNWFQKKATWVFPDSLGYVSAVDMQKNFSACDSVLTQVSAKDFALYAEKAIGCANGQMSKATNTMADAGEHIYAIYLYDPGSNRYKRVILDMTGDWSQQNLATKSKEVVEWMKTIK